MQQWGDTVTIADIIKANSVIRQYVKKTPLIRAEKLEKLFGGAEVYLKLENLQYTGSFKVRGVVNKMLSLSKDELARGVTAASSGNHAQAVAYIASIMGAKAIIVMPENAPATKVDGTKGYGAQVVSFGFTGEDRELKCNELVMGYGYTLIHSHADPRIIAGHGTVVTEAAEQLLSYGYDCFDEIVIPCGAGSLTSGASLASKNLMPAACVTAVEPAAVPRITKSLEDGGPVTVSMGQTIADGLRVGKTEPIIFELIRDNVDVVLTIGEQPILDAVREVLLRGKVVAEPSGCVGIAAALDGQIDMSAGRRVCFVITGGNMDSEMIHKALDG